MCSLSLSNHFDSCEQEIILTHSRRKLWQIQPRYLCAIIGTCLTICELKKLFIKANIPLDKNTTDYEMHQATISYAQDKSILSSAIHKLLDKKYARQVAALKKIKCINKLSDYWQNQLSESDITGNYWAMMSHPKSTLQIWNCIFGDIHMLSHLQGASNRYSVQYVTTIKTENKELRTKLKKTQSNNLHAYQKNEGIKEQLKNATQELKLIKEQLKKHEKPNQPVINNDEKQIQKHNAYLEKTLESNKEKIVQLKAQNHCLSISKEKIQNEFLFLSKKMSRLKAQKNTFDDWSLEGKKILYLGGRKTVTPHIKHFVESKDGQFIHHDGGIEANKHQMKNQICQADMVFCPINCISHDACLRAKHSCQKQNKLFIPLRSSGLTNFTNELQKQMN